jgi:hypothetical protein
VDVDESALVDPKPKAPASGRVTEPHLGRHLSILKAKTSRPKECRAEFTDDYFIMVGKDDAPDVAVGRCSGILLSQL